MTDKEKILNEIKRRLRDNMLSYQKDKRPQFNKLGRIMEDEDLLSFIDSLQEEPAPKILEDMLNAKTPAESLGISAEEHDRIVDELIYGKEPEMVDIDDLPKEEPVSKVWHDASNLPYNSEAIVIEHSEYGTSIVPACKMSRVKGSKWALLEDILKL